MYRHLLSPLMTFVVSNPISLFCLVIVILSFTTQYTHSLHLINIWNTICLIFLTIFISTRTPSSNPATITPGTPQTPSPSPSNRTPPSPSTPHCFPLHYDVQDPNSFLDLSSEESFQDSGLGLSITSLGSVPSEDKEVGSTARPIHPLEAPAARPATPFRDQPTPSLSSESSFQLFVPGTPGTDYDENEEYVTLGTTTLQRDTLRRHPADSHEDPIMILIDRLAKLNLGSGPSQPTAEMKKPQPTTWRTKSPTPAGGAVERLLDPIPAVNTILKLTNCCKLASRTFAPYSWEDHNFCYDCSTFHRFIRPMDEDSFFRSTRLAVDNLTRFRSNHHLLPNQPIEHHTLCDVFKPFGSTVERYFQSRLHNGVIVYESAFGVVDFDSEEEAHVAFRALQGRRIRGERAHWRLEFLDPEDETFGERLPTIRSGPPLELIRRLDVFAGELERVGETLHSPSPPTSARAFETPTKKRSARLDARSRASRRNLTRGEEEQARPSYLV